MLFCETRRPYIWNFYTIPERFQKDWREIAEDFRPKFEKDLRKIPD
jgi:hypothetical protein